MRRRSALLRSIPQITKRRHVTGVSPMPAGRCLNKFNIVLIHRFRRECRQVNFAPGSSESAGTSTVTDARRVEGSGNIQRSNPPKDIGSGRNNWYFEGVGTPADVGSTVELGAPHLKA